VLEVPPVPEGRMPQSEEETVDQLPQRAPAPTWLPEPFSAIAIVIIIIINNTRNATPRAVTTAGTHLDSRSCLNSSLF
jgi:hypothetical protein